MFNKHDLQMIKEDKDAVFATDEEAQTWPGELSGILNELDISD